MDQKIKALWIEALRSGEIKQGQGYLIDQDGKMCCLGVLRHIQDPKARARSPRDEKTSYLNGEHAAGLNRLTMAELAYMNDAGKSFHEIAYYIEENL